MPYSLPVQIGSRFGNLIVLEELPPAKAGKEKKRQFLCKCNCGNEKAIRLNNLRSGTQSCGDCALVLPGQRYGMLVVIGRVADYISPSGKTDKRYECRCDCGNISTHHQGTLRKGGVRSCGCQVAKAQLKHGHNTRGEGATPTYTTWKAMRARCNNPSNSKYHIYGGRGITVCERWMDEDFGYINFLNDMGEKPSSNHSIDRIDTDGDYCPENCRWATPVIQANNTRINRKIKVDGRLLTVAEASRENSIPYSTLNRRTKNGMNGDTAVSKPIRTIDLYDFQGEKLNASEISRRLGGDRTLIYNRLANGWTIERAISTPVNPSSCPT